MCRVLIVLKKVICVNQLIPIPYKHALWFDIVTLVDKVVGAGGRTSNQVLLFSFFLGELYLHLLDLFLKLFNLAFSLVKIFPFGGDSLTLCPQFFFLPLHILLLLLSVLEVPF